LLGIMWQVYVTMFKKLVKANAYRLRGNDIQIISAVVGWEKDCTVRHVTGMC
jgi:hypothetical protein